MSSCQVLQPPDTFCLQLKEGLVGWQADVKHPLRVRAAQPCALTPCQAQCCNLSLQVIYRSEKRFVLLLFMLFHWQDDEEFYTAINSPLL